MPRGASRERKTRGAESRREPMSDTSRRDWPMGTPYANCLQEAATCYPYQRTNGPRVRSTEPNSYSNSIRTSNRPKVFAIPWGASLGDKSLTKQTAQKRLMQWYNKVTDFDDSNFNTVSATIYQRQDEVLNYFVNRQTNASAESLNAKIKHFRAQLHGVVDVKFSYTDCRSSMPKHRFLQVLPVILVAVASYCKRMSGKRRPRGSRQTEE